MKKMKGVGALMALMALMALLLLSSVAQAQSYTVTDLGGYLSVGPAGYENVAPAKRLNLNDSGQVAATLHGDAGIAVLINGNQTTSLAGTWNAHGINDAGQVIGTMYTSSGIRSYISGPNGVGVTDLGVLSTSNHTVRAQAVNNAGRVVGTAMSGSGSYSGATAFITGPNGVGMSALLPSYSMSNTSAMDISDTGLVVGQSGGVNGTDSFLFDTNTQSFTKVGDNSTRAVAVNNLGQVVGSTRGVDGQIYAFMTDAGGVNLRTLGLAGGVLSAANDINDAGQVVGSIIVSGVVTHAFVTMGPDGSAVDLNTLVSLPDGVYLRGATGINNLGQIVAYGSDHHGYLLTVAAIPEPSRLLMMVPGLLGLVWVVRATGTRHRRGAEADTAGCHVLKQPAQPSPHVQPPVPDSCPWLPWGQAGCGMMPHRSLTDEGPHCVSLLPDRPVMDAHDHEPRRAHASALGRRCG